MNKSQKIAKKIRSIMKEKKITHEELASRIGTGRTNVTVTLSNLEKGKSVTIVTLEKIAESIGTNFVIGS